ncbi:hypothetical protein P6F26_18375 [Roseibacterium sp. SDUM158017]|uniref:DUF6782 family putative metallopeptidase n=1 Tax=Roseicyclus salinarum TaxID=3036773 RepID=UPI0024150C1F|nr:DUF6782 family putative metallopeptidase [Roseibacterium sp. SDUM158017]MDG4650415.1 hypothetical protein [Roseibacterium sp. SDUM158017]
MSDIARLGLRGLTLALAAAMSLAGASPAVTGPEPAVAVERMDCLAPPYAEAATRREREIASLVGWLRSALVPYDSLLRLLDGDAPEVCIAGNVFGVQGYYDVEAHRVVLKDALAPALMRAVAVHELRHVQQAAIGVCPGPELSMEATAHATLAMEADASAVSLAIAWQLRGAGQGEVWAALAGWDSHATLADAFEAEMSRSGDLAGATAAAFSAWFDHEWLRDAYYLAACSAYLDRQDRTHALPRYGSIAPGYLDSLCRLPDGESYPCAVPADG